MVIVFIPCNLHNFRIIQLVYEYISIEVANIRFRHHSGSLLCKITSIALNVYASKHPTCLLMYDDRCISLKVAFLKPLVTENERLCITSLLILYFLLILC